MAPAVSVTVAALTELAKLGLQIYFASGRQAGLTDEQLEELLNSERERFNKNVATPLPDIPE